MSTPPPELTFKVACVSYVRPHPDGYEYGVIEVHPKDRRKDKRTVHGVARTLAAACAANDIDITQRKSG